MVNLCRKYKVKFIEFHKYISMSFESVLFTKGNNLKGIHKEN